MSKKVLVITTVIVLLAGGAVVFSAVNKEEMGSETPSAGESDTSASPTPTQSDTNTTGAYIDYREGVVAQTTGTKLLFFYAPWCPQCRDLEASIKDDGVPSGVTIIKVDYDTNQKLRQQYGVTIQTTVIKVDDNGNLVKKYVAYDEPNLDSVKRNLL